MSVSRVRENRAHGSTGGGRPTAPVGYAAQRPGLPPTLQQSPLVATHNRAKRRRVRSAADGPQGSDESDLSPCLGCHWHLTRNIFRSVAFVRQPLVGAEPRRSIGRVAVGAQLQELVGVASSLLSQRVAVSNRLGRLKAEAVGASAESDRTLVRACQRGWRVGLVHEPFSESSAPTRGRRPPDTCLSARTAHRLQPSSGRRLLRCQTGFRSARRYSSIAAFVSARA